MIFEFIFVSYHPNVWEDNWVITADVFFLLLLFKTTSTMADTIYLLIRLLFTEVIVANTFLTTPQPSKHTLTVHTLLWIVLHRTRGCCAFALWHQSSLTVARSLGPSRCLLKPELRTDKAVSRKPTPVRYYCTDHCSGAYVHSEFITYTRTLLAFL